MEKINIKKLQDKVYEISSSFFPLDTLFNDIRDNNCPNYNKNEAFTDLELIVKEIYRLKGLNYEI